MNLLVHNTKPQKGQKWGFRESNTAMSLSLSFFPSPCTPYLASVFVSMWPHRFRLAIAMLLKSGCICVQTLYFCLNPTVALRKITVFFHVLLGKDT